MINMPQVLKDAGFKQVGEGSWKRHTDDPNEVARVQVSDEWFAAYNLGNERIGQGSDWELEAII
jgi:hypothetical protein